MNLKKLNDDLLVEKTKILVNEEKKLTLEILHYLREIESRRLYLILGFSSLYEFTTKVLNYSPSAACRRIESMRLLSSLTDAPQIEEKIKAGELNLTTLAMTQSFFKSEKKENNKTYTPTQKTQILENLCSKSTKEVEKELVKLSPRFEECKSQDKVKSLGENKTRLEITIDDETFRFLEIVKSIMACPQDQNPTMNTVIKKLAKLYIHKKDYSKPKIESHKPTGLLQNTSLPKQKNSNTRYVPIDIRRKLYIKAQNNGRAQCEYKSPITKQRCNSTHGLEIEHVKPFAIGGKTELSNLMLLCNQHNKLRAIQFYGRDKMKDYLQF